MNKNIELGKCKFKIISKLILLLISESPCHGYELRNKINEFGLNIPPGVSNMSNIYRILSNLESKNFISSKWDTTTSPPRKVYLIENEGTKALEESILCSQDVIDILNNFIQRGNIQLNRVKK